MVRSLPIALAIAAMIPATAGAVTTEDFKVNQAQNLLNLCSADESDPLHDEAMMFCFGYFAGAMHFHRGLTATGEIKPMACPQGTVTRVEAAKNFVTWAKANPQHMGEPAIDSAVRSAVAAWPCPK
jgi:hypothetical protein